MWLVQKCIPSNRNDPLAFFSLLYPSVIASLTGTACSCALLLFVTRTELSLNTLLGANRPGLSCWHLLHTVIPARNGNAVEAALTRTLITTPEALLGLSWAMYYPWC